MRLSVVQMEIVDGDVTQNVSHAVALLRSAPGADLYLLPEVWAIGYARDAWARYVNEQHEKTMQQIQNVSNELDAAIGGSYIVSTESGAMANRFIIVGPGRQEALFQYDKVHLFSPLGETQYLRAGNQRVHGTWNEWHLSLSICYDLRFPESYRHNALAGANLFLIPSQWPQERCEQMRALARARAIENQAFVALANRVGPSPAGIRFGGGSGIWGPDGVPLVEGGLEEGIFSAELELAAVREIRKSMPVLQSRVPEVDTI